MTYSYKDIFEYVKGYINNLVPDCVVTDRFVRSTPNKKLVYIRRHINSEHVNYLELDGYSGCERVGYSAEVYCYQEPGLANALEVVEAVKAAFRSIGFKLDSGVQLNNISTSLNRFNLIFHITLGGGEQI